MKIAFLGSRFAGPFGGERHTIMLANELADAGHDITIFVPISDAECSKMISEKVKLVETGGFDFGSHDMRTIFSLLSMKYLAKRFKPEFDIVNAFGWQAAHAAALIKKKYDIPIVYTILDPLKCSFDRRSDILQKAGFPKSIFVSRLLDYIKKIDEYSISVADAVISNGDWPTKQLKEVYSIEPVTIYPGVEVNRFDSITKEDARKRLSISSDKKIFVSACKLHARKNVKESLDIYRDKSDENSILFVVGDGPEKKNLIDYVEKNRINNVKFLGVLPDQMVALYYIAADYFLFTSKNEPFGIAPLEAKAAGCEILGIDTGYPITTWKEHAIKVIRVYENILTSDIS